MSMLLTWPQRIPNIRVRSAAIYILIIGGFMFTGYGFYLANKRPKETIVEKPVDRIVEKVVPAECPPPQNTAPAAHAKGRLRPTGQVGIVIPPSTKIEANANGAGSMAAGINTGTMIQGDPPSQCTVTNVDRNVVMPDGRFKTEFSLRIDTNHPVRLFVKVTGSSLVGDMEWGQNSEITGESTGPGFAQRTVINLYAGNYTVKAYSSKPEEVVIHFEER